MNQNLNPEIIREYYANGKLDKNSAFKLLISIIEKSNDDTNRIKAIELMGEIEFSNSKEYEILEELMVSDSNKYVRGTAGKIIIHNFIEKGIKPIKWAIRNDPSLDFLFIIMEDLKVIDENVLHLILINKFKEIISNKINNANNRFIKYYIEEFKRLFKKKSISKFTCQKLCDMFLNFKVISQLIQKYAISDTHFKYYLKDGLVVRLMINGQNIRRIKEINGLEKLINLEILDISMNQIIEINGIESLINLKTLLLGNFTHNDGNEITEIKGLESLTHLEYLDLSFNRITKIKNLDNLTSLKFLSLRKNNIIEITGLKKLRNLERLNLGGNQIKEIKGLERLTNLKQLYLEGNQITEIKGLETLTNLEWLDLSFNRIKEIEGLENLLKLSVLNLNHNQITEVNKLENLINLRLLHLDKNRIVKIYNLENLKKLDHLSLAFNPITEIRDLN
ncbi:MAG: leucine-rich repeat domain-containing protein [Promethearchaeota archaeon]